MLEEESYCHKKRVTATFTFVKSTFPCHVLVSGLLHGDS
jgi:hypothetical protein